MARCSSLITLLVLMAWAMGCRAPNDPLEMPPSTGPTGGASGSSGTTSPASSGGGGSGGASPGSAGSGGADPTSSAGGSNGGAGASATQPAAGAGGMGGMGGTVAGSGGNTGGCGNAVVIPNNDAADLVKPPSGGLVGNSNYFIAGFPPGSSTGSPMTGLDIDIAVVQDIQVPHHFDFQLNAWSPQGSNTAWQQYIFDYYNPPGLTGFIDNWPSKAYAAKLGLNDGADLLLLTVPPNPLLKLSNGILPAGYTLHIRLQNDNSGNITGVAYSVTDSSCKSTSTGLIGLVGLPVDLSGAPLPAMNIKADAPSPIYALQLNVASQDDVSSGWGTITYSADNMLYVWNSWPPGLEWENIVTAESSNVHFGELPATPSRTITQKFMPP
jgi:hypothetical protein